MWVNRRLFDRLLDESRAQRDELVDEKKLAASLLAQLIAARQQTVKDELTVDWMRHRVNALEKERAQLLVSKGIHISVPEIVPTRPGSISSPFADFNSMPSFEDVGDAESARLGIGVDDAGQLTYTGQR